MSLAGKLISKLANWQTLCLMLVTTVVPHASAITCTDTPSCAIDIRWPMMQEFPQGQKVTHVFVIRVTPGQSVDPEAYIVMRVLENGAVEADYSFPDGESLFAQIRALSDDNLSRSELAKRLKTRTVRLADSETLRDRIRRLDGLCMRVALPPSLYLDATRYDFSEITPMNTFTLSIYDSTVDRKNEVLTWAKSLVAACRAGHFKR